MKAATPAKLAKTLKCKPHVVYPLMTLLKQYGAIKTVKIRKKGNNKKPTTVFQPTENFNAAMEVISNLVNGAMEEEIDLDVYEALE